jgi:hypothetical protein
MIDLDLDGARQAVIGRLNAAGVVASGDPGALAPTVIVAGARLPFQVIAGPTVDVEFQIVCIHPPPGNAEAMSWLLGAGSSVVNALAPCTAAGDTGTYGDPPQPAYTVTVTGELPVC